MTCSASVMPSHSHEILTVDRGCDQCVVIVLASCITSHGLQKCHKQAGALMEYQMVSQEPLELCNVTTKATFKDDCSCNFILNHFVFDENSMQTESLQNPHQAQTHQV